MRLRELTIILTVLFTVIKVQAQIATTSPSKLKITNEDTSLLSYFEVDAEEGNTQMELLNTTTDASDDKTTIFKLVNKRGLGVSNNGGATLFLLDYDYSSNLPTGINRSSLVLRNDDLNNAYMSFWNYNDPSYSPFNESRLIEINSSESWARTNLSSQHATKMKWEFDGEEKMQINNQGQLSVDTNVIPTTLGSRNLSDFKFFVNGGLLAKEILIELGWADYVFDSSYELLSIEDLEKFIIKHKHLPNVPSSKEVENNGLLLGEITKIQQEKIEELFLYTIQQENKIKQLEAKNDTLTLLLKRVIKLEKKISTLER